MFHKVGCAGPCLQIGVACKLLLHVAVRVVEDPSGEGFHVNSSWTIPISHSVSVEEIRVFEACACVNRQTSGMF